MDTRLLVGTGPSKSRLRPCGCWKVVHRAVAIEQYARYERGRGREPAGPGRRRAIPAAVDRVGGRTQSAADSPGRERRGRHWRGRTRTSRHFPPARPSAGARRRCARGSTRACARGSRAGRRRARAAERLEARAEREENRRARTEGARVPLCRAGQPGSRGSYSRSGASPSPSPAVHDVLRAERAVRAGEIRRCCGDRAQLVTRNSSRRSGSRGGGGVEGGGGVGWGVGGGGGWGGGGGRHSCGAFPRCRYLFRHIPPLKPFGC
jgi:hypothetical protein